MGAFVLALAFGTLIVSGVLIGAGVVLQLRQRWATVIPGLLAFASGTLLGAACLGLIPEAISTLSLNWVMRLVLAAIVAFFVLEKWVLWRHCHDPECSIHAAAGYLILIGDGIHNAVDGLVLGAAFAVDPLLGVTVGVAILAHEIPQEVGDFALLLEGGLSPARAIAYNLLSAVTIFPGILVGYGFASSGDTFVGAALAIAAGAFLYVALADLVPYLHERGSLDKVAGQLLPLAGGLAVIMLLGML